MPIIAPIGENKKAIVIALTEDEIQSIRKKSGAVQITMNFNGEEKKLIVMKESSFKRIVQKNKDKKNDL